MAGNTAQSEPIGRLGWWENTVTDHAEVRAAIQSALTRTCDVDEDTGVPPALSLPELWPGGGPHGADGQLRAAADPR